MFEFNGKEYPLSPGVYLMKDARGKIIYVGKARRLRTRLSSYFKSTSQHSAKTRALVSHIVSIDTLLTHTEKEALLLEESLIKKERPKYNIVLRDDKQYALFCLDKKKEYPRLTITRKVNRDGSVYFGPFTSAQSARITWKILGKIFPLRKCSDKSFKNRSRPCIYYNIKQCLAPCVHNVSTTEYAQIVQKVEMILSGKASELLQNMEIEMLEASKEQSYERAGLLRDKIRAVKNTVERQTVVMTAGGDLDVLSFAELSQGIGLGMVFIRQGRLLDEQSYFWAGLEFADTDEILQTFLLQYYSVQRFIPSKILLPFSLEDDLVEDLLAVLSERAGKRVSFLYPSDRQSKDLLELARKIAPKASLSQTEFAIDVLLQEKLHLTAPAHRIECVDISHLGGTGVVAGLVVYEKGVRYPQGFRSYKLAEAEGTFDDYLSMELFAKRRINSGSPWPDLLLIDGGKGQLVALERALREAATAQLGDEAAEVLGSIHLVSIAKGETRGAGELGDRIFLPNRSNPVPLREGSAELLFLQRVRDEAHNFVLGAQRKTRKNILHSQLENIAGIGKKTAVLLLNHFGSMELVTGASEADLAQVVGIGKKKALMIYKALQQRNVLKAK